MREPKVVGSCLGCEKPVVSGEGVRTDPQGGVWHPDCRLNPKTSAGPAPAQDAPKRRGRPPNPRPTQ